MIGYLLLTIGAYIIYNDLTTSGGRQNGQKVRQTSNRGNNSDSVRKSHSRNTAGDRDGGITHDGNNIKSVSEIDADKHSDLPGSDRCGEPGAAIDSDNQAKGLKLEVNNDTKNIDNCGDNNGDHVDIELDSLSEHDCKEAD